MNHLEHYHDWLRDAHAMEKQAESMLESMAGRIDNYPDLRSRIEQHVTETKRQITVLEEILDRNNISRSVLKDSMSKMAAFGQSMRRCSLPMKLLKGQLAVMSLSSLKSLVIPPCLPLRIKLATSHRSRPSNQFWQRSGQWPTGC